MNTISLFKYLRSEHVDSMLGRGTIRLGTLHEYRDIESHGAEIGDLDEGRKWVFEKGRG